MPELQQDATGILPAAAAASNGSAVDVGADDDLSMQRAIRSLELRVQGQLNTIRNLELQLKDACLLIKTRSKQLAVVSSRWISAERQQLQH